MKLINTKLLVIILLASINYHHAFAQEKCLKKQDSVLINKFNGGYVGIAYENDDKFWICCSGDQIVKTNYNGVIEKRIPHPAPQFVNDLNQGGGMAYDNNSLWVMVERQGKLYEIQPNNGRVLRILTLPWENEDSPNLYGISKIGDEMWISQYRMNVLTTLYKLDIQAGKFRDSLVFMNQTIVGITLKDKNTLLAINNHSELLYINLKDRLIEQVIPTCMGYPTDLSFAGDKILLIDLGENWIRTNKEKQVYIISGIN